jgi:hypothetical protein
MSGTRIRQKFVKKRSLHEVNEYFSQIFNAIIAPRSSREKVSIKQDYHVDASITHSPRKTGTKPVHGVANGRKKTRWQAGRLLKQHTARSLK